MLKLKALLAKIAAALTGVGKPQTMYRPLSADQKSNWTYTATMSGVLYLNFVSSQRTYITVTWNNANIPHVALPSGNILIPYTIILKKGDIVSVTGLTSNCFILAGTCCFIAYGFQG